MPKDYIGVFIIGGVIAAAIIAMSVFNIVKAVRRAKEIGMTLETVKKTIVSSAVFSIVPSIPIVIGVGIMMSFLGVSIPWIRLIVIGALQYEIVAMDQVGLTAVAAPIPEELIATALVIMTISILSGPLFNLIGYKKLQTKLQDLQQKNSKLLDTITGSLLGGIVAGLASYIIAAAVFSKNTAQTAAGGAPVANGIITLITLGISMFVMALCGLIIQKFKQKWLENYALPITMLVAMGSAYALTFAF
jgi:hypothetical protein